MANTSGDACEEGKKERVRLEALYLAALEQVKGVGVEGGYDFAGHQRDDNNDDHKHTFDSPISHK